MTAQKKKTVDYVQILGTGGPQIDSFQGETMVCIMCGKEMKSDPNKNSQWRVCEMDGEGYYACTKHFPPDGSSEKAFARAYQRFFRKALQVRADNTQKKASDQL